MSSPGPVREFTGVLAVQVTSMFPDSCIPQRIVKGGTRLGAGVGEPEGGPTVPGRSGRVLMAERMRIGFGKPSALWLYFYGETAGNGRIHVGYMSEHLRNTHTN